MHIPDGFLSPPVWAVFDVLSVPAVGLMARRSQRHMEDRKIPLLGVMGAFVFAAQMIDFPVGLGTSGHLVGGTLLAITFGPAAAAIVMTAIISIQAFVFQDGGIMALGANVFNMAIAGVLAGYLPYRVWGGGQWRSGAIFAGGVLSVLTSACLALGQLLVSGIRMPGQMVWVSLGLFLVSALIEGAVTLGAVRAIERLNPRLLRDPEDTGARVLGDVAVGAVILAVAGILVASTAPDGIQKLATHFGVVMAPANYEISPLAWPWFASAWLRRAVAGVAGLVLIYGACVLTMKLMSRQRSV
jgi:cobalt/nickel transport system permease protein